MRVSMASRVGGREQERLAREADVKFRVLLDEALRRGVAARVG